MLKNINYPIFCVENNYTISSVDLKNLRKFYAPILGSDAILLYEYLRDLTFNEQNHSFYDFDSLTYLLNMDNNSLNDARIKLESVSLISTFIDHMNRKTLFVIEKPLDRSGFKKNLILANKLISIIGKHNFESLIGIEKNIHLTKSEYLLNASAKYDEVFDQEEEIKNMIENHEINSRDIDTQEINLELQEKLVLNNFQYPNPYEAILKTDSKFFYSQLSNLIPTNKFVDLIKSSRNSGFNDPCINLVLFYANEVNKTINYNFVKAIIEDLISKDITSFEAIENFLDRLIKIKNKVSVTKKDLYKATYLEKIQKNESNYN